MLLLPRSQVVPSGALRATSSAAILPPAPGRFSITTCWPQESASFWPRARARISLGPPGVKPTTKRTGFSGQPWASAVQTTPTLQIKAEKTRFTGSSRGHDTHLKWRTKSREKLESRPANLPGHASLERLCRPGPAPAASARGPGEDQASPARHARRDAVRLAAAAGKKSDRLREDSRRRERGLGRGQPHRDDGGQRRAR